MADARFAIEATPIAGLHVVQRKRVEDARGFLTRLYCAEDLRAAGFDGPIAQINHTLTRAAGAVRGMHFQYPPAAEDKYVTCIRGEVLDVAVDLRAGSPTFLHWHGVVLSPDNARSYFIPKGFAHGFQTLVADSELLYRQLEAGRDVLATIAASHPDKRYSVDMLINSRSRTWAGFAAQRLPRPHNRQT